MKVFKDIYYKEEKTLSCVLDLYIPDTDSFKTIVYFHGGGLESGTKDNYVPLCTTLVQNNFAVACVNYRLYPTARYPEFIEDGAAAVAWAFENIKNYGNSTGIYVCGSSAGAYISMMLCFDKKYLAPYGIAPTDITTYVHDAGQPTCHFNVLKERGIDSRRVIIDESAPLYHIGTAKDYSPMIFIVSDDDMPSRYEQIQLTISTLRHFGFEDKTTLKVMHGTHCHYEKGVFEDGRSMLGVMLTEYLADL